MTANDTNDGKFDYNNLFADAVKHLNAYVGSIDNGLDDLKFRLRDELSDEAKETITSSKELLLELEKTEKLAPAKTEILRKLSEKLELKVLEDKVYKYELYRSGKDLHTSLFDLVLVDSIPE